MVSEFFHIFIRLTGCDLRCSFCGKSKDAVRKFISGPSVYICNECIALCNEILAEDEERDRDLRRFVGKRRQTPL